MNSISNNKILSSSGKFKRWSGISSPNNNSFNHHNINYINDSVELKRELELRSLELMKKDEEIRLLRERVLQLNDLYSQEVSICCNYSNSLSNLKKEVTQMKDQFNSKENQYKKQIQELQMKLYCQYQPEKLGI